MVMKVNVLFFSVLRDLTGVSEVEWELPGGSSLADLLESLFEQWPGLRQWQASLLLAVNHDYSPTGTILTPGCEVAIMPPVQGG
jgi:molybdopterin converting factor small subunit